MSDELKPKIDLKARLGKRGVQTQAGAASIPPPIGMARPGAGPALGSAPGQSSPAAGSVPYSQAPSAMGSRPFGSAPMQQPVMAAPPAPMRIEIDEEEVQAGRKQTARKMLVFVAIAGVAGIGFGFVVGGRVTNSGLSNAALGDAQVLIVKLKKAASTVEKLGAVVDSARTSFKSQKFPADDVGKLGELNIAFSADDIPLGIGRFKADLRKSVLAYVKQAEEANERKEALQSILSAQKGPFEQLLADRENPKVRWGAVVASGSDGPWIELAPITEPFLVKEAGKSWPEQMSVRRVDGQGRASDAKVDRISKTELKMQSVLPINPATQSLVCPSDVIGKVQSELYKLQLSLNGDETPGAEKVGLKQLGENLVKSLSALGGG